MAIALILSLLACAAKKPSVKAERSSVDAGVASGASADAGVRALGAGEVCAGRNLGIGSKGSSGPPCAEGLVCCFPSTGIYDPDAKAFCVPPCAPGTQFCTSGCYSPPVP